MADAEDVDSDCENPAKRFKSDSCNFSSSVICGPSLLRLSDDVLLLILSRLKACDLISLSKTCRRFANVSLDHTLWTHVDCRDNRFNEESLNTTLRIIGSNTRYLALDFLSITTNIKGEYPTPITKIVETITEKCTNLQTLILESVIIKAKQLKIESFPTTLRHLSLKGSHVNLIQQKSSYLFNISATMPGLEVLILSDCHWLEAHSLLAIAKCIHLRELRLNGCSQLGNCLAYCSMAARFSFKSLETLDLRGTQMGDSEVACFNRVSSLRHLYLASPTTPTLGWQWRTGADHIAHACMIVCQRNAENRYVSQRMRLRPDLHRDELERMIQTASNLPVGVIENLEAANPGEVAFEGDRNPAPLPQTINNSSCSGNAAARNPSCSGTTAGSDPSCSGNSAESDPGCSRNTTGTNPGCSGNATENNPGCSGNTAGSNPDGGECSSWSSGSTPDVSTSQGPSCSRSHIVPKKVTEKDDDDDDDEDSEKADGEEKDPRYKECIVVVLQRDQDGENQAGAREDQERRYDPRLRNDQLCGYFVPPIPRRGTDLVTDNAMYDLFDTPQRDRQLYVRLGCEPPASSRLQSLVLRNYRGVTDNTLLVVADVETIRYLDVTGTSVTRQAVEMFGCRRPDVEIISDFSGGKLDDLD